MQLSLPCIHLHPGIHTSFDGCSLAAGITIEVSHGYRVRSRDDEFVKEADVFGENFSDAAMPNNYIVDRLPFRKQTSLLG